MGFPRSAAALAAATLLCVGEPAWGDAELVLVDGQRLRGVSIEKREGLYLLELASGDRLTVPLELVQSLALTGEDQPAPTGLVDAEPETLAGPPGEPLPPDPAAQVAALGPAAEFVPSVIDPTWKQGPGWIVDPGNNQFRPTRWAPSVFDPTWRPTSALGPDVTQFAPTRWLTAPWSPVWWPSDGYAVRTAPTSSPRPR